MAEPAASAGGAAARPVVRVLVVDDDPDVNRLVQVRLSARGFQVASAADGQLALDYLARVAPEHAPDLMFLDVAMPGYSGLEVLERVRAEGRDVAVIMMTAFGSEEVAIGALRHGADDYLRKPFERQDFLAALERTVTRIELRRQNAALQRQLEEQQMLLEAELARAAQVQAGLLPADPPLLPGYDLAARFLPAGVVGGDFYDWQTGDSTPGDAPAVSLTLGDVMGKGMPAALLMATTRAALRANDPAAAPGLALERARAALGDDLSRSGRYVTLFRARLEPAARRLRFVDAGHGHVLLRRASGRVEELRPRGLPLGIQDDVPYEEGEATLAAGDTLVVYSDGLLDSDSDQGPDRANIAARICGAASAAEMAERLIAGSGSVTPPEDDLTVLVLRCTDDAPKG